MSSITRRFGLVLLVGGMLAAVAFLQTALAQKAAPAKPAVLPVKQPIPEVGAEPSEFTDAITLPKNGDAKKVISAAEDLIKEEAWGEASRALQSLLEAKEDAFLDVRRKDANGKESVRWVSIRAEANRLIGSMPPEGLQFYELQYGPQARVELAKGRSKGDITTVAEVAQKYLHTEAGIQATRVLAHHHLDSGRYLMAALCYERLLNRLPPDKVTADVLLKATIAFHRIGDSVNGDASWKELTKKAANDNLKIGDHLVKLEQVRTEVDKAAQAAEPASIYDWTMYRGNLSRTAQGHGGPPFLEKRWSRSTTKNEFTPDPNAAATTQWIEESLLKYATDYLEQRQQPVLPTFFPIALNNKVIFRAHDAVYCLHLKDGKYPSGRDYKVGEVAWMSRLDGGLFWMGLAPDKKQYLTGQSQWISSYLQYGPQDVFFGNSVIGTLSTDGARVYAIDDLSVPPPPQMMAQFGFNPAQMNLQNFQNQFNQNKLVAIGADHGKVIWDSDDVHKKGLDRAKKDEDDKGEFGDSTFFLGPPLVLGGKLYVLCEKFGELRLLCLNPENGSLIWAQALATARDRLPLDASRRLHAVNLAYGDGVLVCPTNAGAVLGVDLLTHSLVWAHSYRENDFREAPVGGGAVRRPIGVPWNGVATPIAAEWRIAAPAIQDGKVVLTAPDGQAIHCLNLRDGQLLWKEKRSNDDLYLAGVYNGKVLLVGRNFCRALRLADGKQAWRTDNTGIPSGQGVASANVYYLPLRTAGDRKEPAVYGIDVEKGTILSRTQSRLKEIPGNLVFYEGEVLSQTANAITAYPQLNVKLEQIDQLLAKNRNDPVGLTERGELRLDKGELQGALDDLHAALAGNPPAETQSKARAKLYDTLTELLQRDFGANEKYLGEYKDLCKAEQAEETQRRQANYLCLLAKGRENQGRFADAFDAYMDFGALTGNKELVSVIDEPATKSRPDVWARGRIAAMMGKAVGDQRKPLEERIGQRWNEVKDTNDLEALRKFVDLFGSLSTAGRQARLQLAKQLMNKGGEDNLRDAQLHLLQLRGQREDLPLAGQAVDALAQLMLQRNMMDAAALYYRELGRDFAKIVIRDGKTGADLFSDLATDKRFLPYLDEPRTSWNGRFKASEQLGQFPMQPAFAFEADGELLPFFQNHRVSLDMNGTYQLRFIDRSSNQEWWRTDRLWTNPNFGPNNYLYNNYNLRHTYRVMGHLVLFNLGYMVYALDPVEKKKLWEINLLGAGPAGTFPQQARILPDRDGFLQIVYADGWTQRIGQTGPVEPSYVALMTRNGLIAVDPARGTTLWTKTDVSPRTQIFGDAQMVYLVETDVNGNANASRAVRAQDGVTVDVPPFHELYQKRLRIVGGNILLQESDGNGSVVLRLNEVRTGQDLWRKSFPMNSQVLRSDEEFLAGAVTPDGQVSVTDLRTLKETLRVHVPKEQVEKLQEARLLADEDLFYVILNKPPDPKQQPWGGGPWTNVSWGMRAVTVNGSVYAFERQGNWWHCGCSVGEPVWYYAIANQMMVLDQFKDVPLVIFTSRYNKLVPGPANQFRPQQVVILEAYEKKTGKVVQQQKELPNTGNQFYALNTDARAGTIELVSHNLKVRFFLEGGPGKVAMDNGGAAAQPRGLAPPAFVPQQVPAAVPIRVVVPQRP